MSLNSDQQLTTSPNNSDRYMRMNNIPANNISVNNNGNIIPKNNVNITSKNNVTNGTIPTTNGNIAKKQILKTANKSTSNNKIDSSKYIKQIQSTPKMLNKRSDISQVLIPSPYIKEGFDFTGSNNYIHYIVIFLIIIFIIIIFLYV